MEQMNVPNELIVQIDYENQEISAEAKNLRPVVYEDGDSFCCLLGPDPQRGITGCGNSPEAALEDWDLDLKRRLAAGKEDDEVAQYAKDSLNASNKKVW